MSWQSQQPVISSSGPPQRGNPVALAAVAVVCAGVIVAVLLPLLAPEPPPLGAGDMLQAKDVAQLRKGEARVALAAGAAGFDLPWYGQGQSTQPLTALAKWEQPDLLAGQIAEAVPAPGGGLLVLSGANLFKLSAAGQAQRLAAPGLDLKFAQPAVSGRGDILLTGRHYAGLFSATGQTLWQLQDGNLQGFDVLGTALHHDGRCMLALADSLYGGRHEGQLLNVPRGGLARVRPQRLMGLVGFAGAPDGGYYCSFSEHPSEAGLKVRRYSAAGKPLWSYASPGSGLDNKLTPLPGGGLLLNTRFSGSMDSTYERLTAAGKLAWTFPAPQTEISGPPLVGKSCLWLANGTLGTSPRTTVISLKLSDGTPACSLQLDAPAALPNALLPDEGALLSVAGGEGLGLAPQGMACLGPQGERRWSFQTALGLPRREPLLYQGHVYILGTLTLYTFKPDGSGLALWSLAPEQGGKLVAAPEGVYLLGEKGDAALLNSPP